MEHKALSFEFKSVDDAGVFEGYAAVTGNIDSDGDKIVAGAFEKTIKESSGAVPILFSHDVKEPIGIGLSMKEDSNGLLIKGQLDMNVQRAREVHSLMRLRALKGLSIGYNVPKGGLEYRDGIRDLKQVNVLEYSPCVFPANPMAQVDALSVKAIVPYQDLPLADESRGWDAGAARGRVKAWAAGDFEKYRRAFLWCNPDKSDFAECRFPIADVSGGKLIAVPKAIFLAASDINEGPATTEAMVIKRNLERYYKKLGKDSPFGGKSMAKEFKAEDFNSSMAEAEAISELWDQRYQMESALRDAISDNMEDDTLAIDNKKQVIATSLTQYCSAMTAWWSKYIDLTADDPDEAMPDEGKSGRTLSSTTMEGMKEAIGYHEQAMGMLRDATKMHRKGIGHLQSIMTYAGQYQADRNAPNPMGSGKSADGNLEGIRSLRDTITKARDVLRAV